MLCYDCVTSDCTEKNQEHLNLQIRKMIFSPHVWHIKYYCVISSYTRMPPWSRQRFPVKCGKNINRRVSRYDIYLCYNFTFFFLYILDTLQSCVAKLIANRSDFCDNKAKLKNIHMKREHRLKSIYCSSSNRLNSNKIVYHLLIHTTL